MTANHGYFELLCALAASDELTDPSSLNLTEHSLQCVFCRDRILEMTKINTSLVMSHAFNHRNRAPARRHAGTFHRASDQGGCPAQFSFDIGLGNLGLASALFIVLLLTAAAIRTGPLSRPAVDTSHFDAARLSNPVQVTICRQLNDGPASSGEEIRAACQSPASGLSGAPVHAGAHVKTYCQVIWNLPKSAIFLPHCPCRISCWQRCRRTQAGCHPGLTCRRDSGWQCPQH